MGLQRVAIFVAVLSTMICFSKACGGGGGCSAVDCTVSDWGSWSSCSKTCGYDGVRTRSRTVQTKESCSGKSCPHLTETLPCPNICCPLDCQFSWGSWSPCIVTCGYGTQIRHASIKALLKCGGKDCPTIETMKCGDGRCCPVNCQVGSWGSWGSCNAACEKSGQRKRSRSITRQPTCGGTACPSTTDTKACSGPCCSRNCILSTWSAWSKCSSRSCATNSGTQSHTRRVTTAASCGGSCSSLSQTQRCTPTPVTCVLSAWGGWQTCVPSNGKCGGGSQKRVRRVVRQSYCSPSCSTTQQTRSCFHSCCPVNCQVSNWQTWTACSTTCGRGTMTRKRAVTRSPSCAGQACPSLLDTKQCAQYNDKNCVMGGWGAWSVCDNGCGSGRTRKTRKIISREVCRGTKCGVIEAFKVCTDYRNNRDCKVGQWTTWGSCDQTCTVGTKRRTRLVTVSQRCRGNKCPALKDSAQCGSPNNGCQHKCTNGACSCNPGYNLVRSKQCVAKDCGQLTLTYCAPGTQHGTTCQHATVSCPNKKTTYPVSCSIVCSSTYAVKGVSSVSCTAAGTWSSTTATYCRRINDPPTQIVLSGSHSVSENLPNNTPVGVLSSVDPNTRDTHQYSLISGGEGKFVVIGDKVYTSDVLDFETMNTRYDLTIRSTDNGNPPFSLNKIITISLTDVNEQPTSIQLSNYQIQENCDIDTVVGLLTTSDQDNNQGHSYTMKDTASGRYKIEGKTVKVALSNKRCLENGGHFCAFNYETRRFFSILVQSTDNGSPALSINVALNITLSDMNDQPRGLGLSGNTVMENATKGEIIGRLFAQDEDKGQLLTYSLSDNDRGRFAVHSNGSLYKMDATDYEKNKTHVVIAVVKDNGTPNKKMERKFLIEVLDVNEPPIDIHLNGNAGQTDHAQIKENANPSTVVGTLVATDNDASQNLTFTLDKNALGVFALSGVSCKHSKGTICTAKLLVSGDIDYEISRNLEISIRVTDQHGSFKVQDFNISVIDVNERPTNITISGSLEASVFENIPASFVGELVTSDDDEGQNHSYALLSNAGIFEIRGNELYLRNSLDFETKNEYVVKVTSTDDGNPPLTSPRQTFQIHVLDRNERPTRITLSNSNAFENMASGTIVGNLTIDDPDNYGNYSSRQSHVCSLSNSAQGKFRVVVTNGQISLAQAVGSLDYEKASLHNISVVCRDPRGLSLESSFGIRVIDVNEAPTKVILSNTRISENQGPITIGILSTQDPDNQGNKTKQSFRYTVLSPSLGPLVVDGDALKTTRSLNYETARSWTVVVRAHDNGTPVLYRDQSIVVDVIDKNDRPTAIQLSNVQVKENSDLGTLVGILTTSDEDVAQKHTYKIIDSASGRFKIDGNSVSVALSNTQCLQYGGTSCALNYEKQASYNITVRTTDNGNPTTTYDQTFEIFLVDINDQPRDLRLSNNQVKENVSVGAVIGSFSARDEDVRQTLRFTLLDDDGGRFSVNARGELITAKKVDHEAAKSHLIQVEVTDNGYDAKKFQQNFTIEILNVNEAPIAVSFTSVQTPNVLENTTAGSIVGTLVAQDADARQNLQFRLDDDSSGEFSLVNSTSQCAHVSNSSIQTSCTIKLKLAKSLNYEITKIRYITVRVTDNHSLFKTQRFAINVTDCNDVPTNITLSGGVSAVVDENANGVFVGGLETSDEDSSQRFGYELLGDAGGLFRISGSKIYLSRNRSLDFEKQSVYTVTVRSSDNGVPSYDVIRHFTIFVSDINEQPTNIMLSGNHIQENSLPGTVIAKLTVDDPDNTDTLTQNHSCAVIGQNSHMFTVNSHLLVNTVKLDHEGTPLINITIECTDDGAPALKYEKDFTVVVDDMNERPLDIILSTLNVRENAPPGVIGTLSTIDPDNSVDKQRQKFVYQLTPEHSAWFPFQIVDNNLTTTQHLDYEMNSSWSMVVQSRDSGNPPYTVNRSFVIKVQDVNEAPTSIILSPYVIEENAAKDILIGRLATVDEDRGQRHRYTLVDGASGRFKLVNGAEIRIETPNKECLLHGGKHCRLNYETQQVHLIRVRSTDDGYPPQQFTTDLNITLRDVNDQPRNLSLSRYWVKENATVNTTIGRFTASDEDNDQLTYTLTDNGHGLFGVTKDGRLFVAKPTDHEKSSKAIITVNVTDNGSPPQSMEKQFTIIIQNVNEAPINTTFVSTDGQQAFTDNRPTIAENSPVGTVVGTLVSLDQDAAQTLNFTLDDSSGGRFSVNPFPICHNVSNRPGIKTSCSCKLQVNGPLNYEDMPQHDVIVRVTDTFGHFHVSGFTIRVLDRNDQPSNVTLQGSLSGQVKENSNDEMIGELVTSDQDGAQSHTYALRNSSNSRFTLKGRRLYTAQRANLNYEEQQQFEIVVVSTDDGKPTKYVEQRLTIQVQDVNESPTKIALSRLTVNENSPEGTLIANITVSDPDNLGPSGAWQTHTCQLLDSAGERFKIINATNTLLVDTGELNYERDSSHEIVVQCIDSASRPLAVRQSFRIGVLDLNETPIQIRLSNNQIPENSGAMYVGDLGSIDPDNEKLQRQTFTYALVSGSGEDAFFISGYHLRTNRSLDFEKKSSWVLLIKTRDNGGLTLNQNFTIHVQDTNDRPTDILASPPLVIFENSSPGSPIVAFSAVDEDAGQTHRFFITHVTVYGYGYNSSIPYHSSLFRLDSSSGRLLGTSPIDFETYTQIVVVVMTQDSGYPRYSLNKTFVFDVRDVNEPPNAIKLGNAKIPENSVQGSVVGNLSVLDPDNVHGNRHHYECQVVNDVPFQVTQLKLVVARAVLNFEDHPYYLVKVNCSQKGDATFNISRIFGINVVDVNEAPFNLAITNSSVEENNENGEVFVGTITAQDPDDDKIVFEIAERTSDSATFFINGTSLFTSGVFNYENKSNYVLTLMAIDDGKPRRNSTRQFNITILDMNDKPERIDFFSSGVNENATNGTVVGNFSTVDQDKGQTHFYRLLNCSDLFKINGNQLVVLLPGLLDFETKPKIYINVQTTNNGSPKRSYKQVLEVNILDVNEAPYIVRDSKSLSVKENMQGSTMIVFDVRDYDANQTHSCNLTEGRDFFEIKNTANGSVLWVKNGAVLNYETNQSTKISLHCCDDGSPRLYSKKTSFLIHIIDVNEKPTNIYLNGSDSLMELTSPGHSIGRLRCDDPDQNQTHSFQVVGAFSDTFNVTKNQNILTVISSRKLDYEKLDSPVINIEIKATDDGDPPLWYVQNLSLTIKEVNEGANRIRLNPPNVTLNETLPPGTNISELMCNNPEGWQTVEYSLFSHQDLFMIKSINSSVTYEPAILTPNGVKQNTFEQFRSFLFLRSNLSWKNNSFSYDILVGVTDNGEPRLSFNDTVNVIVAKVDPCVPQNDCHMYANCTRINGFNYSCLCKDGYEGDGYNCTEIDDCLHSSRYCDNDTKTPNETCSPCRYGNCSDLHLTFNCTCYLGFDGPQCRNNIYDCNRTDIEQCHHGECHDGINNITCSCYRGYTAWLCKETIKECGLQDICRNRDECEDGSGVDTHSCSCAGGFFGTRCDRRDECPEDRCLANQACVPYRFNYRPSKGRSEEEEEKETGGKGEKEDKEYKSRARDVCFSGDNLTTIYLSKNLTTVLKMANTSSDRVQSALKITLEDWFLKYIRVLYVYIGTNTEYYYNLSDVYVVNITANPEAENISVAMIARVGDEALSERGLVCSLSYLLLNNPDLPKQRSCPKVNTFEPFTSNEFRYTDYLCPTVKDIKRFNCVNLTQLRASLLKQDAKFELPVPVIYTLAAVGAALLVIAIVFALIGDRSHKFNLNEAMRRRQQYDHVRLPEEDDEHYRDVMIRHHITNTMSQSGAINPIYGLDENEDESQMIQNPLYGTARVDSPPTDHRAFANPLYESVKREPGLRAKPVLKNELNH